jgi:hypothetical protein
MRIARTVAIALCALLSAAAARADEAALRKRIQELEEQQRIFNQQLRELREELDRERAPAAAAPAPSPAAPAVVAPVAPSPPAAPAAAEAPAATPVQAAEPQRIEEVERKQGILTEEIRKIREFLVLPETQELKGYYGLGPGASKVYGLQQRGLSIGGYGETNFKVVTQNANGTSNEFDFVRFVAYLGYKFTDKIILNSEVELEHATTESTVSSSSGAVELEFATLDYLYTPAANARGGLMLVPVGFINEVHEPPFYLGNVRPPVETQIIPTTWRSLGAGVFGQALPGLEYKAYGITSFNALGYRTLNLRDARQSGDQERADDWSFVGRLDYAPLVDWSLGGSLYLGDQGQGEEYGNVDTGVRKPGVFTQLYEIHTQVQRRGLWFRALGTTALIDDAGIVSLTDSVQEANGCVLQPGQTIVDCPPIGKVLLGAYAEVAYDVLPFFLPETTQYLAPWFRYSWLDTNNKVPAGFMRDQAARRHFYEFGLQYKPIPQVVLKADYHIQDAEQGTLPDEIRIGGGFVF